MDCDKVARQMLRAVRGKTSQATLSTDLGFTYNQVHRWETGKVGFYWSDFVKVCAHFSLPLARTLHVFFGVRVKSTDCAEIVRLIIGMNKVDELAKQTKRSKHSIYRWMNGQTEARLSDALLLMYKCSNFTVEFISALVGYEKIPALASEAKIRAAEREFHFRYPLFGAVIRCFELTAYERAAKHTNQMIADHVGVSVAEVRRLIALASKGGLIKQVGGKYKVVNKALSIKGDSLGMKKLATYWLKRQVDSLAAQANHDFLSDKAHLIYTVFTTNSKTYDKIQTLTQEYKRAFFALLYDDDNRAATADLDRVVLYYNQLMDLSVTTDGP